MREACILLFAIAVLVPCVWSQGFPLSEDDPAIIGALGYVAAHQNPDGGFGQYEESDLSTTSRAVEAIVAAGRDPLGYEVNGLGPDDYFLSVSEAVYLGELGTNPLADRINLILGASACGLDPGNLGGRDHVNSLLSLQNASTNAFGSGPSDTAYAILALLAADVPPERPELQRAREYLEASQLPDGTFEYSEGWGPDSNTHSVAIIALKKMGSYGGCFEMAVGALPTFQNQTNGGFFYQTMFGMDSDVSSSALGIQAIVAAGHTPEGPPYAAGAENPLKYILDMQDSETGEFFDQWGSLRPTVLAIPAVLGKLTPGVRVSEIPVLSFCLLEALLLARASRWKA